MDIKNLTEPQVNEICKAFVYGRTIEDIASIEQLPVTDVAQLLKDNAEKVQQLKTFYKSMGVI
jgi:hypothetical protein